MMRICVDAGHGGKDPGAVGQGGLLEKDVALAIARWLKKLLLSLNHDVILTRSNDTFVSLSDRCRLTNAQKADLFISIHCNSAGVATANGVETFHHPTSKKGIKLATLVHSKLITITGLRNRGIKQGNFQVLRNTAMPAILVEVGFINNLDEEKLLGDPIYQVKCAIAIAEGIKSYEDGQND